jgi:transcriptional regulator with XRE-family HTH domain
MIEENQLFCISEQIKSLRKNKKLSLKDLSTRCELSSAMLSKIENRRTIPSLSTLMAIASALEVELVELLKNVKVNQPSKYLLIKKSKQKTIHKENAKNFDIHFIHSLGLQNFSHLEMNHILITPGSQRDIVETEGHQYIYCLKGSLKFILGDDSISMSKGDTLYFDGSIPHVPQNNTQKDVEILVVYLLR